MANQWIRCSLGSALMPFFSELGGRSIIVPQYDENYDRYNAANTAWDKGVPQVFYMHNVLPAIPGFQSVGYDTVATGLDSVTDFVNAVPLQDSTGNRYLFSPGSGGELRVYDSYAGGWIDASPVVPITVLPSTLITYATVEGQTYIFFQAIGCFTYSPDMMKLIPVFLNGLNLLNILGIVDANGYMVAYDNIGTQMWSAQQDATDFVPDLATGAGSIIANDVRGFVKFCLPIAGGYMIYCTENVVSAVFTGNTNFPWNYAQIPWTKGVETPSAVSWQANGDSHYCITSGGIMQIAPRSAQLVFPDANDFLAARKFEDFDEDTLTFIEEDLTEDLIVGVSIIGSRYMCFSYGRTTDAPDFVAALVFDMLTGRWGKLKVVHRYAFEWNQPTTFTGITYDEDPNTYAQNLANGTTYADLIVPNDPIPQLKKHFAFLQGDGTILLVNMDLAETNANGVFLLGKFQHMRNYFLTTQAFDVETVRGANTFAAYVVPTLDGKNLLTPIAAFLQANTALSRRYLKMVSGQNVSLLFVGAFNLTSVVLNYTVGGQR